MIRSLIIAILIVCISQQAFSQEMDRCQSILLNAIVSSSNFLQSFANLYPNGNSQQALQNAIQDKQVWPVIEGKVSAIIFDNYCHTTNDSLLQMHIAYHDGICSAMTFGPYVFDLLKGELYPVWYAYDKNGEPLAPEDISIILWEHPIKFSSDELEVLKRCW